MSAPLDVADVFAGPGGWSEAVRALGLREFGVELDPWACATRVAAGHATVRADATRLPLHRMAGKLKGLIASPPCGTFSAAGKGEGIDDIPLLHDALDDLAAIRDTRERLAAACSDPRTPLVVEPLRYAMAIRPEWIALEQVPAVLPLWTHIARILERLGYSTWTGILNAADYGVPQTRRRAILIASRVRHVDMPEPTHYDPRKGLRLWGTPWVSMAEALGWDGRLAAGVVNTRGERTTPGGNEFSPAGPSWALTEKTRSWKVVVGAGGYARGYGRDIDEPSPTIRHQTESWVLRSGQTVGGEGRAERGLNEPAVSITGRADLCAWRRVSSEESVAPVRISVPEAAVLQSFRPDYPFQGTKTQRFLQVGNACPPRLSLHVLSAATGIDAAGRMPERSAAA